jgi:pantoate--beta-alanine ligase
MEVIRDPEAMRALARQWWRDGRTIGFVPTMGNLHAGHLSLMARAAAECEVALASIYVNPLQFGAGEDLDAYPRTFAADCAAAEAAGVQTIFAPSDAVMYPPEFATRVTVDRLTDRLCGASRPGHFAGVTTVVMKLLCLILPHRAYFGEKDWQQLRVVARMNDDLGLGCQIIGLPIVREPDGLAMSSRNQYLSDEERLQATSLSRGLQAAAARAAEGVVEAESLCAAAEIVMARQPAVRIDYIELVDPLTLERLPILDRPARLCVAAYLGKARLIDNRAIEPAESIAIGGVSQSQE